MRADIASPVYILTRRNFFARLQKAVKVIRASTQEMTSPSLRALKAVTRAMFPLRCDPGNFTAAHEHVYDNGALCCEDDSQRIFPGRADTGIAGSAAVIVRSTSTARNYFDELITLCGSLLTSTINFEFPPTLALYSSPW